METALWIIGILVLITIYAKYASDQDKRRRPTRAGRPIRQAVPPMPHPELEGMRITCKSSNELDVQYTLDVNNQTCTCPDWQERRRSFDINIPFRLCKHLCAFYEETGTELPPSLKPFEGMIYHFALEQRGIPLSDKIMAIVLSDSDNSSPSMGLIATKSHNSDWINVHESSLRYGYNPRERRWSYQNEPPHAKEVIKGLGLNEKGWV